MYLKFDQLKKSEVSRYTERVIEDIKNGKMNNAYKALRKLDYEKTNKANEFTPPTNQEMNLSSLESAEVIANHFSLISQEFDPININELPQKIQERLFDTAVKGPQVEEYQVYEKLKEQRSLTHLYLETSQRELYRSSLLSTLSQ